MKRQGPHPHKRLTAVQVRNIKKPGRYADGNCLYLVVEESLAKHWVQRVTVRGKRRDLGLGSVRLISLAEARDNAFVYRKIARSGGDPLAKRRETANVPTFSEAAEKVYAERRSSWRNAKHQAQWINTLRRYVFPFFGDMPVHQIDTPDVLRMLGPIWLSKPETARRVKQRVATVFDWTKAAGFRSGDNPVDGVIKGLPKQPVNKYHHAAMPYRDVPGFADRLQELDNNPIVRFAFEFLILTAARTREVLEARWEEIDFDSELWTIPASRMKSSRPHRIPVSQRTMEILKQMLSHSGGGEFIFPGRSAEKFLSNMALLMVMRRMELPFVVHGFRSSFRDWSAEQTNFPHDVCEAALAHIIKDKSEAAYRRGDLLEKRRRLMDQWSKFVTCAL